MSLLVPSLDSLDVPDTVPTYRRLRMKLIGEVVSPPPPEDGGRSREIGEPSVPPAVIVVVHEKDCDPERDNYVPTRDAHECEGVEVSQAGTGGVSEAEGTATKSEARMEEARRKASDIFEAARQRAKIRVQTDRLRKEVESRKREGRKRREADILESAQRALAMFDFDSGPMGSVPRATAAADETERASSAWDGEADPSSREPAMEASRENGDVSAKALAREGSKNAQEIEVTPAKDAPAQIDDITVEQEETILSAYPNDNSQEKKKCEGRQGVDCGVVEEITRLAALETHNPGKAHATEDTATKAILGNCSGAGENEILFPSHARMRTETPDLGSEKKKSAEIIELDRKTFTLAMTTLGKTGMFMFDHESHLATESAPSGDSPKVDLKCCKINDKETSNNPEPCPATGIEFSSGAKEDHSGATSLCNEIQEWVERTRTSERNAESQERVTLTKESHEDDEKHKNTSTPLSEEVLKAEGGDAVKNIQSDNNSMASLKELLTRRIVDGAQEVERDTFLQDISKQADGIAEEVCTLDETWMVRKEISDTAETSLLRGAQMARNAVILINKACDSIGTLSSEESCIDKTHEVYDEEKDIEKHGQEANSILVVAALEETQIADYGVDNNHTIEVQSDTEIQKAGNETELAMEKKERYDKESKEEASSEKDNNNANGRIEKSFEEEALIIEAEIDSMSSFKKVTPQSNSNGGIQEVNKDTLSLEKSERVDGEADEVGTLQLEDSNRIKQESYNEAESSATEGAKVFHDAIDITKAYVGAGTFSPGESLKEEIKETNDEEKDVRHAYKVNRTLVIPILEVTRHMADCNVDSYLTLEVLGTSDVEIQDTEKKSQLTVRAKGTHSEGMKVYALPKKANNDTNDWIANFLEEEVARDVNDDGIYFAQEVQKVSDHAGTSHLKENAKESRRFNNALPWLDNNISCSSNSRNQNIKACKPSTVEDAIFGPSIGGIPTTGGVGTYHFDDNFCSLNDKAQDTKRVAQVMETSKTADVIGLSYDEDPRQGGDCSDNYFDKEGAIDTRIIDEEFPWFSRNISCSTSIRQQESKNRPVAKQISKAGDSDACISSPPVRTRIILQTRIEEGHVDGTPLVASVPYSNAHLRHTSNQSVQTCSTKKPPQPIFKIPKLSPSWKDTRSRACSILAGKHREAVACEGGIEKEGGTITKSAIATSVKCQHFPFEAMEVYGEHTVSSIGSGRKNVPATHTGTLTEGLEVNEAEKKARISGRCGINEKVLSLPVAQGVVDDHERDLRQSSIKGPPKLHPSRRDSKRGKRRVPTGCKWMAQVGKIRGGEEACESFMWPTNSLHTQEASEWKLKTAETALLFEGVVSSSLLSQEEKWGADTPLLERDTKESESYTKEREPGMPVIVDICRISTTSSLESESKIAVAENICDNVSEMEDEANIFNDKLKVCQGVYNREGSAGKVDVKTQNIVDKGHKEKEMLKDDHEDSDLGKEIVKEDQCEGLEKAVILNGNTQIPLLECDTKESESYTKEREPGMPVIVDICCIDSISSLESESIIAVAKNIWDNVSEVQDKANIFNDKLKVCQGVYNREGSADKSDVKTQNIVDKGHKKKEMPINDHEDSDLVKKVVKEDQSEGLRKTLGLSGSTHIIAPHEWEMLQQMQLFNEEEMILLLGAVQLPMDEYPLAKTKDEKSRILKLTNKSEKMLDNNEARDVITGEQNRKAQVLTKKEIIEKRKICVKKMAEAGIETPRYLYRERNICPERNSLRERTQLETTEGAACLDQTTLVAAIMNACSAFRVLPCLASNFYASNIES